MNDHKGTQLGLGLGKVKIESGPLLVEVDVEYHNGRPTHVYKKEKNPTTNAEYQKKGPKYTGSAGLHRVSPKMGKKAHPKPPPNPDQTSTKTRPTPSKRLKGRIDQLRQQARDLTPKIDDSNTIPAAQPQVNTPVEYKDILNQEMIFKT